MDPERETERVNERKVTGTMNVRSKKEKRLFF